MHEAPSPAERRLVAALLGREPQGDYTIAARDADGRPAVLCNAPSLDDGTPMPTRYWLVSPEENRRIGQLEAAGGVRAAEREVDADELAAAHARYAAERDAALGPDHRGRRPSGGVGGTRQGVKCLHAHWAWHLAGGNDPVGRWIATQLMPPTTDARPDPASECAVYRIGERSTEVRLPNGFEFDLPWGSVNLTEEWLSDHDPPRPEALTNALGTIDDHLDDLEREADVELSGAACFVGDAASALARLEVGSDSFEEPVCLTRRAADEAFRTVATEPAADRAHNPGLPSRHVGSIVATCCIVLAVMRRFGLDRVMLAATMHGAPSSGGLPSS